MSADPRRETRPRQVRQLKHAIFGKLPVDHSYTLAGGTVIRSLGKDGLAGGGSKRAKGAHRGRLGRFGS